MIFKLLSSMRFRLLMLILLGFMFTGCEGNEKPILVETSVSTSFERITEQEMDAPLVTIESVQVRMGASIEFRGQTTVAEGNCLYTKLYQDEHLVDWWPVGKCYPVSEKEWNFSVPLGVEGAPEALDAAAQYRLLVWWPGAPDATIDEFYFDLTPPPAP